VKRAVSSLLLGALASMPVSLVGQVARPSAAAKSEAVKPWTPPRMPDGKPDLQGIWDFRSATPLERPREFAGREFLTDQEAADLERRAAEREQTPGARAVSIHPYWWLDYGTKVVATHRTSLIVDPPDGRVPAMTPDAQKRQAARRAEAAQYGPVDSPENRNLWERCVTRELPEAMLPGPYNSNIQIVQSPGYVVILMEMIHDARIIPLDGRAHLAPHIRPWTGDPRGHWEGDTLVVETTNFSDKTDYRGSGANLRLVERFSRITADVVQYRVTVEDPTTWTRPWTIEVPMVRSEGLYEYACHEGNYGIVGILSGARAAEKAAGRAKNGP
jgi:hypothetical protein